MTGPLPTAGTSYAKLVALDGLRGLAASWVVLHHMHTNRLLDGGPLLAHGYLLVDMFFVLSGFVLALQYGGRLLNRADIIDFMRRRFARIWPLHAAILAAMFLPRFAALVLHGPSGSQLLDASSHHSLGGLAASLVLVNGMGILPHNVWNGPSWTISVEFYTYLLFALLVAVGRGRVTATAITLAGFAAVLIAADGLSFLDPLGNFIRCIYGFFAGAGAVAAFRARVCETTAKRFPAAAVVVSELCLWAGLIVMVVLGRVGSIGILFVPLCVLMVLLLAFRRGATAWLLEQQPFQALGAWSLGIYLLHIPVLNILYAIGRRGPRFGLDFTPAGWGGVETLLYLVGVIFLGAASYRWIERPVRIWLTPKHKPARPYPSIAL